jgi:hypothetical protein
MLPAYLLLLAALDVLAVVGFAAAAGIPTSIRLIKVYIFYLTELNFRE